MGLLSNRYGVYFLLLILTMIVVPLLFHFIPDKQQASLIAGALFVFLSLGICIYEWRSLAIKSFTAIVSLLFLVTCALPILSMRIIYWGEVFNELKLLGVPMAYWHKGSNIMYIILCLAVLQNYRQLKNKKLL